MNTARLFNCVRCHRQVAICSTCDRGNIYCGPQCSRPARQASMREAAKRYQNTHRGRMKHALRQQRYRQRQIEKVTHQGSPDDTDKAPSELPADGLTTGIICHFCKKRVSNYLRLDFLRHGSWRQVTALSAQPQAP